jgi:hypothetical protein
MSTTNEMRQRRTVIEHLLAFDWKNILIICGILAGFFWLSADHHNDQRYLQIVQYEKDQKERIDRDAEQKLVLKEKIERIDTNVQILIQKQMDKPNR